MIRFSFRFGLLAVSFAGLSLMLVASQPGASNANPPLRSFGARVLRANPGAVRRLPSRLSIRRRNAPSGCTSNSTAPPAPQYFVAVGDASNYAGGLWSEVVGGDENEACDFDSGIGSGSGNIIGPSDGNGLSFIGGGGGNAIDGDESFIGAGSENVADGVGAFVGGGVLGTASSNGSFVGAGGGEVNDVAGGEGLTTGNVASGEDSFVGAGDLNDATGNGAFVGGGGYTWAEDGNTKPGNQAAGTDSFVGSGDLNTIGSAASFSSILGGNRNNVTAEYASILGGFGNEASGSYSIVAGGDSDTAGGMLSFVAGYHADAAHSGSFVWSDFRSGSATLKDSAANQFLVRASGGTYVYSNESATTGVALTPGSGTWASLSDRNAKTGIVPLDDDAILAKVSTLPIDAWQYKSERGVRHVGPMAQDFYAAFGTGADNRHITSIDEDGVALAAIKAVNSKLDDENAELLRENARIQSRLAALEAKVDRHGAPNARRASRYRRR